MRTLEPRHPISGMALVAESRAKLIAGRNPQERAPCRARRVDTAMWADWSVVRDRKRPHHIGDSSASSREISFSTKNKKYNSELSGAATTQDLTI